jgi:hypothetical protein
VNVEEFILISLIFSQFLFGTLSVEPKLHSGKSFPSGKCFISTSNFLFSNVIQLVYDRSQLGLWVLSKEGLWYSEGTEASFTFIKLSSKFSYSTARIALTYSDGSTSTQVIIAGKIKR